MAQPATVTATEIAQLAGVGRAAVSNWRRRHGDFPQPVGGTAASPVFALASVEVWLRAQGRLSAVSPEESTWQQVRALYGDLQLVDAVTLAGRFLGWLAQKPRAWQAVAAEPDDTLTQLLPGTLGVQDVAEVRVLRSLTDLAGHRGAAETFDYLVRRLVDTYSRRMIATPSEVAELMVDLAGPVSGSVFDPACGTGGLLVAAARRAKASVRLAGQELDESVAGLARARAAFLAEDPAIVAGDALRTDAFSGLEADVVLCNPPFNERNWGHEELGYDARWTYGVPPRAEPELAWVQHALAHAKPGGSVVVLMPPAAASRRSGRRIRAELLRQGVLRAVIAVPAGAVPLHLWVMRRTEQPNSHVLLLDARADGAASWQEVRTLAVSAWRSFSSGQPHESAVPVIDLLDDEVDLAPSRHTARTAPRDTGPRFLQARQALVELLDQLRRLLPEVDSVRAGNLPMASVGELAKAGALTVLTSTPRQVNPGGGDVPLLTAQDVVTGRDASGLVDRADLAAQHVVTRAGDVVVPAVARHLAARVVTDGGAVLGPHLHLIRVDADQLDPWFVAGFLRADGNLRFASSLSSSYRVDVRRSQVPRVPLIEQQRYAEVFRRLDLFERTMGRVAELGTDLARFIADGLVAGALQPSGQNTGDDPHE